MATKEEFLAALAPLLDVVRGVNPGAPDAAATLQRSLPLDHPAVEKVRTMMRQGVDARWLCERENAGVRYSRVAKDVGGLSVDAVHMSTAAVGHVHPQGEMDLCFAVEGNPRFDGNPAGWTVYAPNTWHIPTVEGGSMDILYFLPGGAITFGPCPPGATPVGKQAP